MVDPITICNCGTTKRTYTKLEIVLEVYRSGAIRTGQDSPWKSDRSVAWTAHPEIEGRISPYLSSSPDTHITATVACLRTALPAAEVDKQFISGSWE
ncbi:hypothetical protein MHYP_G00202250 [Metynnis hypsauchen]